MLSVPVHELATTEQYLAVLDGHPPKFAPGERFAYCNGGFVVLALVAERASGVPFHELVRQRVCELGGDARHRVPPLRRAPRRAALGYLEADGAWRTNVFHLPVRGSGDGGIYTTVDDVFALLASLLRRQDRLGGLGGRADPATQRVPGRPTATGSASGCTNPMTR